MKAKNILKYTITVILFLTISAVIFLALTARGKYFALRHLNRNAALPEKIEAYEDFTARFSGYIPAKLELAEFYLMASPGDEEKLAAAVGQYEAVLASEPDNTTAMGKLADIAFMRKELEEAVSSYRKILELSPEDSDTLKKLAMSLYYSGQTEEAAAALEKALSADPDAPELNMTNAIIHQRSGDLPGAIIGFRKAASGYADKNLTPLAADAYQRLGLAYMRTDLFFDAAGALKKSVNLNPEAMLPYVELAAAYLNIGMFNSTLRTLEKSPLEIDTWDAPSSLGGAMIDKKLRSYVYDLMARAYIQKDDLKNAIEYFEKARKTGTEYPEELLPELRERVKERWKELTDEFVEGLTVKGTVSALSDKAISLTLKEDVQGYISMDDISWSPLPVDIVREFKIGQDLRAVVLAVDNEKERVRLGLKQLRQDPWEKAGARYEKGQIISAPIARVTQRGAYVRLEEGIEGYISSDDISWTDTLTDAGEVFSPGEEVEAVVLSVDIPGRKISLGTKQLLPDPWSEESAKYSKGQRVEGTVVKTAPTGAFVDLGNGIRGFIRNRDIFWTRNVILSSDAFSPGDEVEAVVLEIDDPEKLIILGVKQTEPDPWPGIEEKYAPGSETRATVARVSPFGVHVELEDGLEAIYPMYRIAPDKVNALETHYPPGEKVTVVIRSVVPEEKKILILIKENGKDEE